MTRSVAWKCRAFCRTVKVHSHLLGSPFRLKRFNYSTDLQCISFKRMPMELLNFAIAVYSCLYCIMK